MNKKIDYPLTDSEFMNIDDELYIIIQKTLAISYNINEDKHLHNWYCDIRNKLCQQIQDKKVELSEGQYDKTKKYRQLEFNFEPKKTLKQMEQDQKDVLRNLGYLKSL